MDANGAVGTVGCGLHHKCRPVVYIFICIDSNTYNCVY